MILRRFVSRHAFVATLLLLGATMTGCSESMSGDERQLRESILIQLKTSPDAFLVTKVMVSPWDTVCVLIPYQDRVTSDTRDAERINEMLGKINFRSDESYWAAIFVSREEVRVMRVTRGANLDFAGVEPTAVKRVTSTDNFEKFKPVPCNSRSQAYFVPNQFQNRTYIFLGGIK